MGRNEVRQSSGKEDDLVLERWRGQKCRDLRVGGSLGIRGEKDFGGGCVWGVGWLAGLNWVWVELRTRGGVLRQRIFS